MRYTTEDETPLVPEQAARAVAEAVTVEADRCGFALPRLSIEPGRSIVGPAAVALYLVGSVKAIAGVRTYVAVDGGMADNIRPGDVRRALHAHAGQSHARRRRRRP